MNPFAYEHFTNNNIRKIVLAWYAKIKLKEEIILNLVADDVYIVEKTGGEMNSEEFAESLISYSFFKFSKKYNSVTEQHSVKFRALHLLKDDLFEKRQGNLLQLLKDKWLDKFDMSSFLNSERSTLISLRFFSNNLIKRSQIFSILTVIY